MSDRITVGVVGAGAVAQVAHLPMLARMEGVAVTAICDNDTSKARSLADRFSVPNVFDDIEDLLTSARPDAVVICTPNHLHEIHVKTALSAGAHVLCERPIALSVDGVRQVISAQQRAGRIVMAGFNYRYRADVQAVKSFLERGELGRLHAMRGGWYTFRPSRQALGWRQRREQSGGGAMLDLGLGLIDLALWLAGNPVPRQVTASFSRSDGESDTVEDAGCALIRCDGGITLVVDVSWHWVGESEHFWFGVHGSEGSATISPLRVFKEMNGSAVDVTPTGASGRENPFTTSYAAEWASFVAAIKGIVAAPSLEAQVVVHQVMEAMFESAREGGTVEL